MDNKPKQRMAAAVVSLCMGLRQARTADIAQMAGACGFDGLYIDMEPSPVGFETVSAICIHTAAHDVTPLVRVPRLQGQGTSRALGGGTQGVILPHVNAAAEGRETMRRCRTTCVWLTTCISRGMSSCSSATMAATTAACWMR